MYGFIYINIKRQFCELSGKLNIMRAKVKRPEEKHQSADGKSLTNNYNNANIHNNTFRVKLPEVKIPQLNGDSCKYYDWASWSYVNNCDAFEPVHKLFWLKKGLVGDAVEILVDIHLTGDAYETAWKEVENSFQNTRVIIACHVNDLLYMNSIKNDSEVRDSLRKVSATLRGLEIYGINITVLRSIDFIQLAVNWMFRLENIRKSH